VPVSKDELYARATRFVSAPFAGEAGAPSPASVSLTPHPDGGSGIDCEWIARE
jgi:hypothetical protein